MRPNTNIFVAIEDRARRFFERTPFLQAFLAGIGVIIFWRGVWEWCDQSGISPVASIIIGGLILIVVGVFVQTFIGNTLIIKEVKQEEKIEKSAIHKMEGEVGTEEITLVDLSKKLDQLIEKIEKK